MTPLSEHFIRYLVDVFFRLIKPFAAVAYPLRDLMYCVFRDALLHTTVVMRHYLPYCNLPVSFFVCSQLLVFRTILKL